MATEETEAERLCHACRQQLSSTTSISAALLPYSSFYCGYILLKGRVIPLMMVFGPQYARKPKQFEARVKIGIEAHNSEVMNSYLIDERAGMQ